MSNWPFRFVHAADFRLETPLFGVEDVPEHLWELFLEAPYRAAQRVFDTAVAEKADFVVLSGDLLHSRHTGPRGPLFLLEQFERLAERNIAVYWAGGRVDPPEAWPPSISLPPSVHTFARGKPQSCVHRRGDTPLARLMGAARPPHGRVCPEEYDPREAGLYSIAMAHGRAPLAALRTSRVDYWAIGGRHTRRTPCEGMPVVHDPGSPQGRQPEETGPHGCTLVEVDVERNTRATFVATDVLRWEDQPLAVNEGTTRDDLRREMDQRVDALRQKSPGTDLLVSWRIAGRGDVVEHLRHGTLGMELLGRLRERFGRTAPIAWSVGITVEPPTGYPAAWYEEDTIRGEFLRQLRGLEHDADEPLGLERCFLGGPMEGPLAELLLDLPPTSRTSLLGEVGMLGVSLLAGEEYPS